MIDIGSTTTDLIPLDRGRVAARGRSDTERLQTGELVYAGVRRTPVCALATELPLRGIATGLAAEIFASTLDVYLTLGISRPTRAIFRRPTAGPPRLRRPETAWPGWSAPTATAFRQEDALAFAHAAEECLIHRLVRRGRASRGADDRPPGRRGCRRLGRVPGAAAGRRVIEPDGPIIGLKDAWGAVASSAGCAFALVKLAAERFRPDDNGVRDSRTGLLVEGDRRDAIEPDGHQGRRQPLRLARASPCA